MEPTASPAPRLCGARGATTVDINTPEALDQALIPLLDQLVQTNGIQHDDVISMFFTLTPDLTQISPAKIARLHLQWAQVPMMCAQEPFIEGLPTHCVRVLVQFYTTKAQRDIRHIYLKGAQVLRPDLCSEENTG